MSQVQRKYDGSVVETAEDEFRRRLADLCVAAGRLGYVGPRQRLEAILADVTAIPCRDANVSLWATQPGSEGAA